MIGTMVQRVREVLLFMFLALFSRVNGGGGGKVAVNHWPGGRPESIRSQEENAGYCLSWRLAVEANNVRAWRTVPVRCLRYVETYMIGGQYEKDVGLIIDEILSYATGILVSRDGFDAWVFDVDDTCISNVFYYKGKRYG